MAGLVLLGLGCGAPDPSPATDRPVVVPPADPPRVLAPPRYAPPVVRPLVFDPTLLLRPDPRRAWAGTVVLVANVPAVSWWIDRELVDTNVPVTGRPVAAIDTTILADGPHTLGVETDGPTAGTLAIRETAFIVSNAPSLPPPTLGEFVDATAPSGLAELLGESHPFGSTRFPGAIAADFDGDGDLDVFAWIAATTMLFFQEAPWTFRPEAGPPIARLSTAAAGDLDADGDPDLVVAGEGLALFRNDGGTLTDVTALSGMPAGVSAATNYRGLTLADVDGDGLTDILAAQMNCDGGASAVLHAEGDLHFVDIADALALTCADGATYGFAVDPVDDSGALEIWAFREGCTPIRTQHLAVLPGASATANLEPLVTLHIAPMGSSWLDADGDGALDLWLSGDLSSSAWRLGRSADDVAPYVGLDCSFGNGSTPVSGWSQVLLDVDADGRTDVFVPHDRSDPSFDGTGSRHGLFRSDRSGRFADIATQVGLAAPARCRAAFGADLDADGDIDILTGCTDGVHVLRNDVIAPGRLATLQLVGALSNPDGLHARVRGRGGAWTQLVRGGGQTYANGVASLAIRRSDAPLEESLGRVGSRRS